MPPVRLLLAAISAAGVALAAGLGVGAGCGTDAVGIEACEAIENARCDAAVACRPDWDPAHCKDYYRDQCLHGIENADHSPTQDDIDACVAAIGKVQACAQTGVATVVECDGIALVDGADGSTSPCAIITVSPELMKACSFVASEPATASASSSSTAASGGAGGQGGSGAAAGSGGVAGAGAGGSGGIGATGGAGGAATGGTGGTGGAAGGGGGQGGTGG